MLRDCRNFLTAPSLRTFFFIIWSHCVSEGVCSSTENNFCVTTVLGLLHLTIVFWMKAGRHIWNITGLSSDSGEYLLVCDAVWLDRRYRYFSGFLLWYTQHLIFFHLTTLLFSSNLRSQIFRSHCLSFHPDLTQLCCSPKRRCLCTKTHGVPYQKTEWLILTLEKLPQKVKIVSGYLRALIACAYLKRKCSSNEVQNKCNAKEEGNMWRGICGGGTEVILVMIWTIMAEEKLKA